MRPAEVYTTPLPMLSMIVLSIATVAEKHGRRSVLVIALLGSAVTCLVFGTSTTLQQAICIRLLQGIFAGAVGVARGCVAFITDPSNEGRAYAILGFCWGMGGVAGAIVGGAFERPADKWPQVFGNIQLFVTYPYLLPCALAALVTFTGSILSCFLGRDGGPREGVIRLGPEKIDVHPPIPEEEPVPLSPVFETQERPSFVGRLQRQVSQKLSGYFAQRVHEAHRTTPNSPSPASAVPLSIPGPRLERTTTFSSTSRANGSAYGYSGSYRNRLNSNATFNVRKGSIASTLRRRRGSNMDSIREGASTPSDLNFAQRLLMANENTVTNIADLWVAAAMNVDNEDPFESDSEVEEDFDQPIEEEAVEAEDAVEGEAVAGSSTPTPRDGVHRASIATSFRPRNSFSSRHRPSHAQDSPMRHPSISFSHRSHGTPMSRRFSATAPSIFAHSGVKTPSAVLNAQLLLARGDAEAHDNAPDAIPESRQTAEDADVESLAEKQPSLASQLPILIIVQYGMLALHTTTHDQVFMSYLVSPYDAGGLNLNAGHFAQLSSLFFIPAYLSVILYRPLASPDDDGNLLVMSVTPPNAVGYANGIAQSIVSLARCIGPVIGGYFERPALVKGYTR
ncbi:hypothetical protein H0H92_008909 [Tricholoma furcatifolium]|nr:hypothetical protein H0H92_008909 [Tricholoma furcatifolium]